MNDAILNQISFDGMMAIIDEAIRTGTLGDDAGMLRDMISCVRCGADERRRLINTLAFATEKCRDAELATA